ncbi:hypothetical protein Aperf_G00000052453 [Anoplocephala perfoliata]
MAFMAAKTDGDFSGKLIIKAQLGDDLRRFLIHNEELTYDELILMMQRVFKPKLDNIDSLIIKYKDEDDEYVTIAEEFDLSYAIHTYRILRLKLIVSESPNEFASSEAPATSSLDVTSLISEIKRLQDDVSLLSQKFEDFVENFKHESKLNSHESTTSEVSILLKIK